MPNLPDFSTQGYKVEKILGVNTHGGRVAYKAVNLDNDQLVVIKQFKFITGQGVWSKYDSLEKECLVLQQLNRFYQACYVSV